MENEHETYFPTGLLLLIAYHHRHEEESRGEEERRGRDVTGRWKRAESEEKKSTDDRACVDAEWEQLMRGPHIFRDTPYSGVRGRVYAVIRGIVLAVVWYW